MSLPPSTSSSIFNSSYFQQGSLTLSVADKRYLLLSGGTIGGSLAATGTLSASALALTGSSPMMNLSAPTGVNNSMIWTGGAQPTNTNGIGIRFVGLTSTGIIRSYNYALGQFNAISLNDDAIRIAADGKVGINRSSPSYQLDIAGTTKTTALLVGTSTDTSRMISCLDSTMVNGNSRYMTIGYDNSGGNQVELGFSRNTTNSWSLGFHSHPMLYGTAASPNYYIGINRSSPSYQLDVNGTVNGSSYRVSASEVINTNKAFVGSGGVDIANRIYMRVNGYGLSIRGDTTNNDVEIVSLVDGSGGHMGTYSSHAFSLMAGNVDRMRVFPTGTVSIGTNSASNARLYLTSGVGNSVIPGSDTIQKLERTGFSQPLEPVIVSNPSLICADNIITYGALFIASDRRLKQDIDSIPLEDARRFVQTCAPRRFVLKSRPNKQEFGYVAQDLLHARIGQLIDLQPDEDMHPDGDKFDLEGYRLSVSYDRVAPLLHTYLLDMDRHINRQPSDRRCLSSISNRDISDDQVLSLRARRWRRNTDGYSDIGLVAQECRAQFPELVRLDPDATMERTLPGDVHHQKLSVDYAKLGVVLLPVVQRLLRRVAALEQQFGVVHVEYVDEEL